MKVVVVHYRFFETGGPERYLFNIIKLLENDGHDVIPFSISHNNNEPTKYSNYFLSPIGDGNVTFANETKRTLKNITKTIVRQYFSIEAKEKLFKLLTEKKPDLVYVLQYQSKMSPSIFWATSKLNIPTVIRISDYSQLCANNILFNYTLNKACEKCIKGSKLNAIKYKCVNNSYIQSVIKTTSLQFHDALNLRNKISHYVIPSKFTISRFQQAGLNLDKISHIPTFYNGGEPIFSEIRYLNYALYIGRVDVDKGIDTLIDAFIETDNRLVIIGDSSSSDYLDKLKQRISKHHHKISFLGKLSFADVKKYLNECLFTICPSIWYENFPNTVLEAFAHYKPVIASDIGSLNEMVIDNKTGLLFQPLDGDKLKEKCNLFFQDKEKVMEMGKEAKSLLLKEFSVELHYSKLNSLFEKIVYDKNSENEKSNK